MGWVGERAHFFCGLGLYKNIKGLGGMMEDTHDIKHYWEMSEPYKTKEDATKAVERFMAKVGVARSEYCIRDVHVIVLVDYLEGDTLLDTHFGSSMLVIPMLEADLKHHKSKIGDISDTGTGY